MASLPYAILPSLQQSGSDDLDDDDGNKLTMHRSVFSVFENKHHEWKNMFKNLAGAWCVGSSRGWLVLLDINAKPLLLNPSSGTCIHFPPFPPAFFYPVPETYFAKELRKNFVVKVVLNSSPPSNNNNCILAMIYGHHGKLAFCCKSSKWVALSNAMKNYYDIVFNDNHLFALAQDGSIERWDVSQETPSKIWYVKPSMEIDEQEEREFSRNLFSSQIYMVISEGEILLVKRYIGNFVKDDGVVVYEGYQSSPKDTTPLICPYRTKHFNVYKLFDGTKWKKVTSLKDRVLFLGANESISMPIQALPTFEANSIYFSDDRWDEMNLDYSYGGHDWGVFNLQDGNIKLLLPYTNMIKPPPIWVVPTHT
ncbi:hypothetical protein RIF29_32732 [Crotalaria pallida]|uniref:KIB1-4 beta-propeller domain-containing protein n=1 Tax=Crotalaria pallida TaxID=3830 RepID=A0AAN9EJ42_CROPI